MAPKRATRTTPNPTATTTTNVTNAQLQTMINQGVSAALAARDATRNGTDSHSSGTGEAGGDERAESCRSHSTAADFSDLDCGTDTTEGYGSTTGTGRHTAGAGDRLTGTGDDIAGTGYYLTGTAGTRWRSCTAGAARGGW
ncbi:hypothetical protein Tco_0032771 [Tanacetum coccineum]